MNYADRNGVLVPRGDIIKAGGILHGEHVRDGQVIDAWGFHNLVVNQGLNYLLGVALTGASQITQWYFGIFSGNYTPVGTDAASSIATNATEATAYTSGTRVPYAGIEGGQQVTNEAAPSIFTFNARTTVYGGFVASASAKGATSGILFAAAPFGSPKTFDPDDQLLLTYVFAAQSA